MISLNFSFSTRRQLLLSRCETSYIAKRDESSACFLPSGRFFSPVAVFLPSGRFFLAQAPFSAQVPFNSSCSLRKVCGGIKSFHKAAQPLKDIIQSFTNPLVPNINDIQLYSFLARLLIHQRNSLENCKTLPCTKKCFGTESIQ